MRHGAADRSDRTCHWAHHLEKKASPQGDVIPSNLTYREHQTVKKFLWHLSPISTLTGLEIGLYW